MADTAASRNIESAKKPQHSLRLFPVEKLNVLLYNNIILQIGLNGGEETVASQETLTKDSIIPILDKLRKPTKGKLFVEVVEEVWGELELEGRPNPTLLENLLIKVIEDLYNEQNIEQADDKREYAINHDISLLMFGLLDGYYHTKIVRNNKKKDTSIVRYTQYLSTNVYVNLEYYGEGTYAEIAAEDQIEGRKESRPLNRVIHIAGNCKLQIGSKLYDLIKSGGYQNCSQSANFDEQTGQRTDLPKPRFIPENYTPRTSKGEMVYVPPPPSPQPGRASQPPLASRSDTVSASKHNKKESNEPSLQKEQVIKLLIWIVTLAIGVIIILVLAGLIFTKTLAENRGQFEVHTSACYMRLDFSPQDYDKPSSSGMIFNEEFRTPQD